MRRCAVTGKSTKVGVSGRHRHSGAWAMRAPSSQKVWLPNLHTVTVKIDGNRKRIKVSTKGLRMLKEMNKELTARDAKALGII